ncbi:hypothetical protein BDB00DRAFT_836199 [Zychaea mexicana]|uniref:uncharacterized protein n=1 Tax=Zychaea mexicana TaxID=64656 RepID=UPI0022FEE64C|nr:uncharacterized protein BDB00DRAFT_836199 [Zychaea mexicana]KAI9490806.1 hypothetical protein BDB00DRAFT_836199 [Zychaea mexicana]
MRLATVITQRTIQYCVRRSLWTSATATARTTEECIQQAASKLSMKDPNVCVALVSKTFPDYRAVTKQLAAHFNAKYTIGCVVDHVPGVKHGISLLLGDTDCVPFHIPDSQQREKVRTISVGRWGRVEDFDRLRFQGNKLNDDGWDAFNTISRPAHQVALPSTLQTRSETPSFVFMASDNEPDQLLHALDHHFPDIPKIGVIGASTPFITGEPYALFCNQELLGGGIVGFASYNDQPISEIQVEHSALEPLGEPLTITRCRGNIILDLDQAGATGLLLALIQQGQSARIAKDQEFYLGVYPPCSDDSSKMAVNRITSGDPSRGNMSVDTTADLQVGQRVQFMKRRPCDVKHVAAEKLAFGVVDQDHTIDAKPLQISDTPKVLSDVFGAASENGVIVGRPGLSSQILDVPYSVVKLHN